MTRPFRELDRHGPGGSLCSALSSAEGQPRSGVWNSDIDDPNGRLQGQLVSLSGSRGSRWVFDVRIGLVDRKKWLSN
jgi:hypothetical protein